MTTQSQNTFLIDESNMTVTATRVFDAPRDLVFRVFFDPKLIPQWWGPRKYTTTLDTLDFRPGGKWRFVHTGPDGETFGFNGEFREITPPERVVYTFEYEGAPGHIVIESVDIEDLGKKTRIVAVDRFASLDDLHGMYADGMEEGANESYDRFEELLERLQNESH